MKKHNYILLILWFCIICLSDIKGQDYVFANGEAFTALMSGKTGEAWGQEFAAGFDRKDYSLSESCWSPVNKFYVVYRYADDDGNLRYFFPFTTKEQMLQAEDQLRLKVAGVQEIPKDKVLVYSMDFTGAKKCIPLDIVARDGSPVEESKAKNEIAAIAKELGSKSIPGNASQAQAAKAYAESREQEAAAQSTLFTNSNAVKAYNELRAKYDKYYPPSTGEGGDNAANSTAGILNPTNQQNGQSGQQQGGQNGQQQSGQNGQPQAGQSGQSQGGQSGQPQGGQSGSSQAGKGGGKGGTAQEEGMDGPFKVKVPIMKWVAAVIDAVLKYFQIDNLVKGIGMVLYTIAPQLFDAIASAVGTLVNTVTKAIVPEGVTKVLNTLAGIYETVMKLYQMFQSAYELATDPRLMEVLNGTDLSQLGPWATDAMKVIPIPEDVKNKLNQVLPFASLATGNFSAEDLQNRVVNYATGKMKEAIDQKLEQALGIKMLGTQIANCIGGNSENCRQEFVNKMTTQLINSANIPALKNINLANAFANGENVTEALENILKNKIKAQGNISLNQAESLINNLNNFEYAEFIQGANNLLSKAGKPLLPDSVLYKIKNNILNVDQLKSQASTIIKYVTGKDETLKNFWQAVKNGQSVDKWAETTETEIKRKLHDYLVENKKFKSSEAENFLNNASQKAIDSVLIRQLVEMGITDPVEQNKILSGNLNSAVEHYLTNSGARNQAKEVTKIIPMISTNMQMRRTYYIDVINRLQMQNNWNNYFFLWRLRNWQQ